MSRFDFTPYRRSTVGFDRLFDLLENQARLNAGDNYPPFNISRRGEDNYRITLAVAGFRAGDIDITAQQNLLVVQGRKRGEVRVERADLADGLLIIDLVREVPDAMKPRKIAIGGTATLTAVPSGDSEDAASAA